MRRPLELRAFELTNVLQLLLRASEGRFVLRAHLVFTYGNLRTMYSSRGVTLLGGGGTVSVIIGAHT